MPDFWSLERDFWTAGLSAYADAMHPSVRMIFPDPVGILDGPAILDALQDAPRWTSVAFRRAEIVQTDRVTLLTYEARAIRADQPYTALCSSSYVEMDGGWKLLCHQQTPS